MGVPIGLDRVASGGILHHLKPSWNSKDISKQTKIKVYESLVLSVLLYNSETWTLNAISAQRLKSFEMTCLRKIEGVIRRDRLRNTVVQERLGLTKDIIARIQQRQLQYFGHVIRMDQGRYPKLALEGYVHGKRNRGRPKRRWLDGIKEDLVSLNMTIQEATRTEQD